MPPPNPLQRLSCLATSSPQFSAQIAAILGGAEYGAYTETLQHTDLMWLVEYLDNVLGTSGVTSPVFRACLRELRRICGIYQTLPQSCTPVGVHVEIDGQPVVRGYYGDVRAGSLDGAKVRVKRLFTSSDGADQKYPKNFYEEAVSWRRLVHPNIVPLRGITITPPPQLISDWIEGGNLTVYVRNNPGADKLGLLSGIASGLDYLHSNDVVHGGIKGPNILVDDSGRVRITDFGLAAVPQDPASKPAFLDDQTARWTAPEILLDSGTHSKGADVFSFAMVMIEVFTGMVPFDTSPPSMAAMAIMHGNRPPQPTNLASSDKLWGLIQQCWDQEPLLRPKVSEVLRILPTSALDKLRRLYEPGMASQEFQLALGRFYCGTEYQDNVDGLHGTDLKEFVDFLDTVLRTRGLNRGLFQQTLYNLRRVCGHRAIIPSSRMISGGLSKSDRSLGVSRSPGIWIGKFSRAQEGADQDRVHVKVMKFDKTLKELYGEVVTWAWLDHPNILQCFGITVNPPQVVSEWVLNGNAVEYVRAHPNTNRICLLIDAVQGLDYLHSCGVIHRGLKSQNVLVNAAGRACLSDIGFTTLAHDELKSDGAESSTRSSRWTAPEVSKDSEFSKQSDVFSFGFVAVEILTGELLWTGVSTAETRSKIADGKRPHMPKGNAELGVTAEMWGMLTKCWEVEAEERITISGVLSFLQYTPQPISGISHSLEMATVRSQCQPSQDFIDELDKVLEGGEVSDQERTEFLNILREMCSHQRSVPKSMRIACCNNEQTIEERHGGYPSAFRGEDRGRPIAIKVVRLHPTNDLEACLARFCKEVVAWKYLQHPNILPFLGVSLEREKCAMISEWMENGNVNEFIQKHRRVNRVQLLVDAAFGLDYMHSLRFVHGDLKGANILITGDGRACLADFGLSTIIPVAQQATTNSPSASVTSTTSFTSFAAGGTFRWTSPELLPLDKSGTQNFRPTTQSDCYALGMVVYEILLGKVPYWEIAKESMVVDTVLRGVRPKKPYAADSLGFTDGLWRIIERSWVVDTDARPDVKAVLYHLTRAASTWNRK